MFPGDDEITTDVDPAWIAASGPTRTDRNFARRARRRSGWRRDGGSHDEDEYDWAHASQMDPEATVGASDGLIERIHQEVRSTPAPPATTAASRNAATTQPPPPACRPAPPSILEQPRPATPALEHEIADPSVETPPPAAAPSVEDWLPPPCGGTAQRPAATAPVTETALVPPPTNHVLDRTKVAIGFIIAVAS